MSIFYIYINPYDFCKGVNKDTITIIEGQDYVLFVKKNVQWSLASYHCSSTILTGDSTLAGQSSAKSMDDIHIVLTTIVTNDEFIKVSDQILKNLLILNSQSM